jgi:hypothetical protein
MKAYFLLALLVPIGIAYVFYVASPLSGIYFLGQFAAIPYVVTVAVLALAIWRARTLGRIVLLSVLAPLLMGALEWVFSVAIDPPELRSLDRVFQLSSVAPMTIAVSFLFVAIAWGFLLLGRRLGWVKAFP